MSVVSERTEKLEEGFDLDRGGGIWDRGSEVWILQDGGSAEMQQLVRSTNKDSPKPAMRGGVLIKYKIHAINLF